MARSKVTFELGTQGIGQVAAGNDFYSGMPFYGTAPGSFATKPYQQVNSLSDAENKGITNDYSDETKATATYEITTAATGAGETVQFKVVEPNPNGTSTTVDLGTYTTVSGDTDIDVLGDNLALFINSGNYKHGYLATYDSGANTLTITARKGTGIALNSGTPLSVSIVGDVAGTLTQFTGGVYSKKSFWHYQISEFFRANPTAILWIGFFASPNYSTDLINIQNAAAGIVKQFAMYDATVTDAATFSSNGTLLQAQAVKLFSGYNPVRSVIYGANIKAVSDLSTLINQQDKTNYYISHNLIQDGNAVGAQLFVNTGISVPNMGCVLGTISKAKVNQDIGEIGAFNITDDTEMAVPAMANGQLVSALDSNLLDQLDAYRYMFATTIPNITGTYINNDWTAIAQTSPYYRISRNGVMSKAVRLIYANIIPLLKSQIELNADGTISVVSIARFDGAVQPVITQMKNAGEVSNMVVTLDPTQNIISTGTLKLGVAIQPTVTADFIDVTMSFVAKI